MKKFQFSLSKVLDYKGQVLEKEKNNLAHLHALKKQIEDRIDALQGEFQQVNQRLAEKSAEGISVIQIKSFEYQLQSIRYQIGQLQSENNAVSASIEKQVKVVVSVSQEISGLDKLEEKQRTEYNMLEAKGSELQIAEFVSSSLIRKRMVETSSY